MADQQMPDASQLPQRKVGAARFWLPFAAVGLLFAALAVAYQLSPGMREAAPGAIRRAPDPGEETRHGLQPERETAPTLAPSSR